MSCLFFSIFLSTVVQVLQKKSEEILKDSGEKTKVSLITYFI